MTHDSSLFSKTLFDAAGRQREFVFLLFAAVILKQRSQSITFSFSKVLNLIRERFRDFGESC